MNIKTDSRKIKKGDIFVALKNSHEYISAAIKKGANLIIAEYGNYSTQTLIVPDTHKYLCEYLKERYKYLFDKIKLIGITGTNGKTTTAFLTHKALNKLGIKCGYIGTIGFYINRKIKDLKNTTPDILDIYELLIKCYDAGCLYVIMEVSSQALDMHRIDGLSFEYTAFTNLTQDHLDYHKTMENYCLCKQQLFKKIKNNGSAIINVDDAYKDYFMLNNHNITYGFNDSDYKIKLVDNKNYRQKFILNNELFETKLIGKYNLYNLAVSIIILKLIGINYINIKNTIKQLKAPDGRMDIIKNKDNLFIIDYAHTPDAVKQVLETINEVKKAHIITIIGCGGNRDKTKRPIMGEVATNLSDYVIFTSDNPRNENPKQILKDITVNLKNKNYKIIIKRKEAIKKAIQMLKKNDILLVLGKGHENYQLIGDKCFYFSDKQTIKDLLRR